MPGSSNPSRAREASFRVADDGGLVVLAMQREIKVLNPVGIRVFALLDGTRSEADIAQVIAGEFEVSAEQAASDVAEFLGELRENGMLADVESESVAEGSR